jgi:hypothetical protein
VRLVEIIGQLELTLILLDEEELVGKRMERYHFEVI